MSASQVTPGRISGPYTVVEMAVTSVTMLVFVAHAGGAVFYDRLPCGHLNSFLAFWRMTTGYAGGAIQPRIVEQP